MVSEARNILGLSKTHPANAELSEVAHVLLSGGDAGGRRTSSRFPSSWQFEYERDYGACADSQREARA